ncbi:MAG: 4'-phosphopantetheinyl transferase superfamily protein [Tyzzerella sp.]|nr:4'-phosphopantetheinyl transferase superfamily protein [Tyzzerella sp.]
MVKIYVADISNLPDPMSNLELLHRLPMDRQQRIHNLKQEKGRRQSMGVGLLLQKVLALYHMQDSQVYVGEHGKPMVEGLEFNLSHSGDLVICVVSDKPVGCDIEKLREAPKGVSERCFSDGEQAYLSQFSEGEYNHKFFELWTMKESYVKMTGEGMGLRFEAYEVVVDKDCILSGGDGYAKVLRDGNMQTCYLYSVEWKGHMISVCTEDSAPVEIIRETL